MDVEVTCAMMSDVEVEREEGRMVKFNNYNKTHVNLVWGLVADVNNYVLRLAGQLLLHND